jgi:DNA-binding beta-propeller fold protein YncE
MHMPSIKHVFKLGAVAAAASIALSAHADVPLATGQYITPAAVPGAIQQPLNPGLAAYPNFVAGMAVRSQLSPDGNTLAVITAGHNGLYKLNAAGTGATSDIDNSGQYLFIYDVSGANKANPVRKQVLRVPNAHVGLVFSRDGNTLYAGGGADDVVYTYAKSAGTWAAGASIALGHANKGIALFTVRPNAGSVAVSQDGATLVVVNNYNDSISVIDTATKTLRYEHDLRPFNANNEGVAGGVGGTFPYAVVIKGNGTAYVSSDRDREVIVVDISSATAGQLVKRVKLDGNAMGMTLDAAQARLYVAQDNTDQVAVIDTASNTVIGKIDARAPAALLGSTKYTGAATTAVTLSQDGSTLYAVNSGSNSIAVIPLSGPAANTVVGLIPTAYEPHDITFSADGSWMYIINGKNATGPNPDHLAGSTGSITSYTYPGGNAAAAVASTLSNEYQFQLERASLVAAPVPVSSALPAMTAQVAQNNFYSAAPVGNDVAVMEFLKGKIQHIIYVVKENRTFDQVLGDLTNGANASPKLTQFGKRLTPNLHRLATQFVTLDNFMNPGDGSMDGWSWAMQGRVTNTQTITQQINYSNISRGLSYESEGSNRNTPVNYPTLAEREAVAPGYTALANAAAPGALGGAANLLIGGGNHSSADSPFGIQKGYIFDAVLNAGKTVRNYGFLVNNVGSIGTKASPVKDPFSAGIVQVQPLDPDLAPYTDVYFRGYDQAYPDIWRYNEWKREFDQFVANGNLPNLTTLRISHDHMGSFGSALGGFSTPETQQADCDYATGKIVEAVANSPYKSNTLIIFTEDDVQDGPDHVDSHRGPAFIVGPYVKQGGVVVSTRYSQVNALRTIEDVLGTQHINLNTAFQRPMADVFDIGASGAWSYSAVASTVLAGTQLAQGDSQGAVRFAEGPVVKPRHSPAYWDRVTAGMNFDEADQVPTAKFNRVLWTGMMGNKPYPMPRSQFVSAKEGD